MSSFILKKDFGLTEPVTLIAHVRERDKIPGRLDLYVSSFMKKKLKKYDDFRKLFKDSLGYNVAPLPNLEPCYWLTKNFLTHNFAKSSYSTIAAQLHNSDRSKPTAFTYLSKGKLGEGPMERLASEYIDYIDEKNGILHTGNRDSNESVKTYKIERITSVSSQVTLSVVRYTFMPAVKGKTTVITNSSKQLEPHEIPWIPGDPFETSEMRKARKQERSKHKPGDTITVTAPNGQRMVVEIKELLKSDKKIGDN